MTVSGTCLVDYAPVLADLRIRVFREYPYLYDGSMAYEQEYLETYMASGLAMAVLVLDDETFKVVGASTGIPMSEETEEFRQPLVEAGFNTEALFYFGESVLLPEYRGQGVYREFFQRREQYVVGLNQDGNRYTGMCFCAVERPLNHPLRPQGYQPLDEIWQHFGYRQLDGLRMAFDWKDVDQVSETSHLMSYWIKAV